MKPHEIFAIPKLDHRIVATENWTHRTTLQFTSLLEFNICDREAQVRF